MIATVTAIRLQYDATRRPEIVLTLADADLRQFNPLAADVAKGKKLAVEVKVSHPRRSLTANAYAWVLMGKLAAALRSTADEVYLLMLERYGQCGFVVVQPEAVERMTREWRLVRNLGPVHVGEESAIQLQCFYGSSGYDRSEMARLIDGIVDECREMGIDTTTPDELARLKAEWGKE